MFVADSISSNQKKKENKVMAKQIKKSAVSKADTKELRALAATAGIKFIGKKTEDLRSELLSRSRRQCETCEESQEGS